MRQFLALELPETERARIAAGIRRLARPADGWRWVRPEGLHVTLRFLGSVDPERDADSRPRWAAAAAGTGGIGVSVGAVGHFGSRGRPRVLWIGIDAPGAGLAALAERVERAAVAAGFEPEPRPFSPHVTLARARRGARVRLPGPLPPPRGRRFTIRDLALFRSDLGPDGARYTVLERYPL